MVADHAAAIRGLPPTELPGDGRFVVQKARNMGGPGARLNAEFQSQITGLPVAVEFLIENPAIQNESHSVPYDGIDYQERILEEVKGRYAHLIKDGRLLPFIETPWLKS
ncbi:hypothetical protein HLA97_03035 [Gordonia araii NBRC 100433]|nr:hypothetical protein [Gordonia araii NBRC 100433]